MRVANAARHLGPDLRVVARRPLAMSWSKAPKQQQVGPARGAPTVGPPSPRCRRAARRSSTTASSEVPVDGEPVVRVALRPGPHVRPLGEQAHERPTWSSASNTATRGRPAPQQPEERLAGLGVPLDVAVDLAERGRAWRGRSAASCSAAAAADPQRRRDASTGSSASSVDPPVAQHDAAAERHGRASRPARSGPLVPTPGATTPRRRSSRPRARRRPSSRTSASASASPERAGRPRPAPGA